MYYKIKESLHIKSIYFFAIFILINLSIFLFDEIAFTMGNKAANKSQDLKISINRIAVLPAVNISGSDIDIPDIYSLIKENILKRKKTGIVPRDDVEKFLIKKRIRDIGLINRHISRKLGQELNAEGIIITSINLLVPGNNPMIGIESRMISGHNGSILWFNYTSLSGNDFSSWFKLNKVGSLEALIKIAVEKLYSNFPADLKIEVDDKKYNEIIEFSANPEYIRSASATNIRLKFAEQRDSEEKIFAVFGPVKKTLVSDDGFEYNGAVDAPGNEGKYFINIEVYDKNNAITRYNSLAVIHVDNTAPKITLSCRDEIFSPNRDNLKDVVTFIPSLKQSEFIDSWEFNIENNSNEIIRKAGGLDVLPLLITWRGEDDFYSKVKDGEYFCSLKVIDKAGNEAVSVKKKINLDNTPPKVQIDMEEWDNKGYTFRIGCDEKNGIDRWQLKVIDTEYKTVKVFEGKQEPPANLYWETTKSAITGGTYSFIINDTADNKYIINSKPLNAIIVHKKESVQQNDHKEKKWNHDF